MPSAEISQQIDKRLHGIHQRCLPTEANSIASYYRPGRGYYAPALAGAERDKFGISLATIDGELHHAGDHELRFALQSLSKVFIYGLSLQDRGRERVLREVGVEPSGDAFNSIVFDERNNRPHNPMVNAGALAATNLVAGDGEAEKLERILRALRSYAGNERLEVDQETFEEEVRTADRNRATAYLMRGDGMITGDVEAMLALYLRQCSVQVTCADLAVMVTTLANGGVNPITGEHCLKRDCVRDVPSVMYTCGMYDFAGEWAYQVGVPAKSGVSGGIMCVIPGKLGIGVFSPGLDSYGKSVRGVRVCQEISEHLGLHVFATESEDAMLGHSEPRRG
jgi:glutaminase